jgi:hypothetical protein
MVYNDHSNKTTLTIPSLSDYTIRTYDFGLDMRPITISLDATTWELAKKKQNFSAWVRDQLRSERNKREEKPKHVWKECRPCDVQFKATPNWVTCPQCGEDTVKDLSY